MKVTRKYALKRVFTENLGINKIVYFANKTSTIKDFYKLFTEGENKNKEKFFPKSEKWLKENQIAVMVSDNSKEQLGENVITLYSDLAEIELKTNETLPKETMLLMATSRLKEGVSIKNDDTFIVICDSHNIVDLVQYMGRFRESNYILYVISDSIQHDNELDEIDYSYSNMDEVKAANNFFKTLTTARDKMHFVNLIEKKRKYIRFNPIKQEFMLYSARYQIERFQQQIEAIANKEQECIWECDLEFFCSENNILLDTSIKDYGINIDDVIEELKSIYYFKDMPIELYDDSLENLKKDIQVKFSIKHKRVTEINSDLRKITGEKVRIEIKKLKYGKPSDNSISTKKHIYFLDIEKL